MGVVAVVPVKNLRSAKARLAPALSPDERHALALTMLERVLRTLLATPGLHDVRIESSDAEALALAWRLGVGVIAEPSGVGSQSEAVDVAARSLIEEGVEAMLMVPLDLAQIETADIERILAADEPDTPGPLAILVPSRDGGTNAALRRPPDALPSRFGDDSWRKHLEEARRLGLRTKILRLPSLWIDVDTAEDYRDVMLSPPTGSGRQSTETAESRPDASKS